MKTAPLPRRDRLRQILADLRMPGVLEALDAILRNVDGGTLTAPDAIEQLLTAQIQLRNNRRLQAAMRSSRLPAVKQLCDFDFTFQPSLRRDQIERRDTTKQTIDWLGWRGSVVASCASIPLLDATALAAAEWRFVPGSTPGGPFDVAIQSRCMPG